MKIRSGFVSNSSTSSFIVTVDKEKMYDPLIVKLEVNLSDFVDETIMTPEELDRYIKHNYDKLTAREADNLRSVIKEGKAILMGCMDVECMRDSNPRLARLIDSGGMQALLELECNVLFWGRKE